MLPVRQNEAENKKERGDKKCSPITTTECWFRSNGSQPPASTSHPTLWNERAFRRKKRFHKVASDKTVVSLCQKFNPIEAQGNGVEKPAIRSPTLRTLSQAAVDCGAKNKSPK